MTPHKFIEQRVAQYYWDDDFNCAETTLKVLSEYWEIPLNHEIYQASLGLPGAGQNGALCGLVSGTLLFLGIWGRRQQINRDDLWTHCQQYSREFEQRFGSLQCSTLRPQGFHPHNPPHLCEPLTCDTIAFAIDFIHYIKDKVSST